MKNNLENRILVVDDEPLILLFIEELLATAGGYRVKTADSAKAALAKLRDFAPDILLLDIEMAGMDGYDLCRQIRRNPSYRFIKIIMVSACARVSERLKAYEAGADDYIAKPFDDQELLAKIRVYQRLKNKEELDRVKGDLLSLLTHETRTPVNGILGCTDLLLADETLSSGQRELVEMIRASSQDLFQFQENGLLLSKLKAGLELNYGPGNVGTVIRAIVHGQRLSSQAIGQRLQLPSDLVVWADWQLLRQALNHVIDNGLKFSPEGGELLVSCEVVGDNCQITVEDQGPGVEPQRRSQIFEEFSIEDVAHHRQGQGISLAISQRIMSCHGGTIRVEDGAAGRGARFIITIPLLKEFAGDREEERPVAVRVS
ncbi:MAG: hybrid sensor histidine kinase/response regulator [Thermodesulfobacteriota bacterium]